MNQASPDSQSALLAICMSMGLVFVAQSMLLLTVPLFSLHLGASPALVGLIVSAPFLLPLGLAIPFGSLADKIQTRRLLGIGLLCYAVAPLVTFTWATIPALFATQFIIGVAHLLVVVTAQAHVASLGVGREHERNFGWYTTSLSIGQLVGPLLGGVLLDSFDPHNTFVMAAVFPILSFAFLPLVRNNAAMRGITRNNSGFGYATQWKLLRTNLAVQLSLAVTVSVLFAMGAHQAFFPVYLDQLAFAPTTIGFLVSLRALAAALSRPFITEIVDLCSGRGRTLTSTVVAVAIGTAAIGFSDTLFPLIFISVMVGIATGVSQPLSMVTIAAHVTPEQRGSALGMRLMGNRAAQVISPLILGSLAELIGFSVTFMVTGVVIAAAAILIARLSKRFTDAEI